jgi:MFS family permease
LYVKLLSNACYCLETSFLQAVFGFGSLQTGLVFFFIGAVNVITQVVLLPALSKRFSQLDLTVFCILVFTVGLIALSAVGNLVFLFLVAAVAAFSFGILYVSFNTLISLNTPKEAQGGALGVAYAIAGLAQTIAPVIAASAFSIGSSVGFDGLVFVLAAVIAMVTVPLVLAFKKLNQKNQ